ncbi:MAG TPA: Gfo/Idh/MocA family oxidoreductase [Polaromonas sp.]|uniref:Gfo/Idh/MocA family protein n=1 Tax=Polaromonas sp. TaxID=1869339 RepID=UPI002D488743|nr:Gfo/Idh/MocA family oxidoreductase [Polaromonas sp.]HYW56413.1 Gfo/Idh/MocA family oxidoreductase [Polaromonas sp.]
MIKFAVIGIDHRHVFELIEGLTSAGATCAGYLSTTSDARVLQGIEKRFPQLRAVDNADEFLQDPTINLIVTAGVPSERAQIAISAMKHGKDVLSDKPGVTSHEQLEQLQATVRETGRLFAICFSERMTVPSVTTAQRLIAEGAVGEVIHTLGMGPHRLNRAIRPAWFFDKKYYGGILADIASHHVDQFLVLTGSTDAEIAHASVAHFGKTTANDFQDFGELSLVSTTNRARGYCRVDWFTPDGLPTWGDGRLFIAGTEGSIEIRKYLDIEGRAGTDHLFLCDRSGTRHVDCTNEPITFFAKLVNDVQNRTQLAVSHEHTFTVCRLALDAQARAEQVQKP